MRTSRASRTPTTPGKLPPPISGGTEGGYQDELGFCATATLEEIAGHGYVLTPGRYVGFAEEEDGGEPFEVKMARLTAELAEQFAESARLEGVIRKNLRGIGQVLQD